MTSLRTPSRMSASIGTQLPDTIYDELARILGACEFEEEETSGGAATFPTPIPETSAAGSDRPREPEETEGGGEETKAKAGKYGSYGDPRTRLETSAVGSRSDVRPRYYRCRQENGTPVNKPKANAESDAESRITGEETDAKIGSTKGEHKGEHKGATRTTTGRGPSNKHALGGSTPSDRGKRERRAFKRQE